MSGRREYGLRVDEAVLKCVSFVGEMLGPDKPGDLYGTGFFVSVPQNLRGSLGSVSVTS